MVHHLRGLCLRVDDMDDSSDLAGEEETLEARQERERQRAIKEGLTEGELYSLARMLTKEGDHTAFCNSIVIPSEADESAKVVELRKKLFSDYKTIAFADATGGNPPKRFELGEAEIALKPGAQPVKQKMFQIQGERREAWMKLTDQYIAQGKWVDGVSPWNSPSFPVAKKAPGEYRLVVDFRAVNEATITDAHPLPLINDILQRQGKYKMWSVLDMVDGYHQVPMKKEHQHITCMSTPRGTKKWTVLVMGLKNAGAQFQRVMEHVLEGLECCDSYIDDIVIGSTGDTEEEL